MDKSTLEKHIGKHCRLIGMNKCQNEINAIMTGLEELLFTHNISIQPILSQSGLNSISKSISLSHKLGLSFELSSKELGFNLLTNANNELVPVIDIKANGIESTFSRDSNFSIKHIDFAHIESPLSCTGSPLKGLYNEGFDGDSSPVIGASCQLRSKRNGDIITTTITTDELESLALYFDIKHISIHFCYRQLLKRSLKTLYTPHHSLLFTLREALHYQDSVHLSHRNSTSLNKLANYL